VQIDVKFIARLKGSRKKHYQFTAIDDCTRMRVLRIYDRLNQTTAIRFVDYVLEKLPFGVEVIQTDSMTGCPPGSVAKGCPRYGVFVVASNLVSGCLL